jgi:DNA-binding NarL/FixJ family response regulator
MGMDARRSECSTVGTVIVVGQKDFGHRLMSVRIFIVDDNVGVREGLRHLLETHRDWEVCGEAANGLEAIEQHRLLRPDLMIIDVSMPIMNGLEASTRILKNFPNVPILLYTSYLTDQLIEAARQAGIRGRISKDTMYLVIGALEALLRGEEFSGPAN